MLTYDLIKKIFFQLSPENAHNLAEFAFKNGARFCPFLESELAKRYFVTDPRLEQKTLWKHFFKPCWTCCWFR